jgi:hypothetical protein
MKDKGGKRRGSRKNNRRKNGLRRLKGGRYYLNDMGEKAYVKDFVGARIVGKTKNGQNIHE